MNEQLKDFLKKASWRLTNWMKLRPAAKESSFPSFCPASTV